MVSLNNYIPAVLRAPLAYKFPSLHIPQKSVVIGLHGVHNTRVAILLQGIRYEVKRTTESKQYTYSLVGGLWMPSRRAHGDIDLIVHSPA